MSQKPITENTLFYGDNLFILREHIPSESVDLIYLDPPFNSSRNYNVLFKDESGTESEAQITAFEDTWHWNLEAEHTFVELQTEAPDHVAKMIESLHEFIGANQMMAYLVMMAARLVELHRVLKPTGSLYLHCDPTASHYLKIILDTIFGAQNFRNEITWKRTHVLFFTIQRATVIPLTHFFFPIAKNISINIIATKTQMEGCIGLIISLALVEPQKETPTMKSWECHATGDTVKKR